MSTTLHDIVVGLIPKLSSLGIRMPDGLPELARRLDVLPLTWDMGGCMALRPTGEIVSWIWDEEAKISVRDTPLDRNRAYSRARPSIQPSCRSCRPDRQTPGLAAAAKAAARCLIYRRHSPSSSYASAVARAGCLPV
jgi:hypothetical protein